MKCRLVKTYYGGKALVLVLVSTVLFTLLLLAQNDRPSFQFYPNVDFREVSQFPEPLIDDRANLGEDELILDIQQKIPNLPIEFWKTYRETKAKLNASCAHFPDVFSLDYNNNYWQTLRTTNGTFQIYGAYMDVRKKNLLGPTVRLLVMLDRIAPTVITHCQFWIAESKEPVIVKTHEYKYAWVKDWGNYRQGIYQPYLIACKIPDSLQPVAVSLVEKPCDDPTNLLKIYNHRQPEEEGEKKNFAVCVKGLEFPHSDLSVKLAEWIEVVNLLGADKIFFYELQVHPNVSKMLNYYQEQGKIHVTPLTLPGSQPNAPSLQGLYLAKKINHKRQNELIPYNDCFYKHMYEYKYIVLMDTDEVIMPVEVASWAELMEVALAKSAKSKKMDVASFNVRNVYFLDDFVHSHGWFQDIPHYMHMLQHVYRSAIFTKPGYYVKSFFNTEKALILHNHYPLACLGNCYAYSIETGDAQLQHYRSDCVSDLKKSCGDYKSNSVTDTTIWKFKDALIERVMETLKKLGYFDTDQR